MYLTGKWLVKWLDIEEYLGNHGCNIHMCCKQCMGDSCESLVSVVALYGSPPMEWRKLVHAKGVITRVGWGKGGCYDHPDHI